ncbi:MAG TPA: hypothetical protein VHF92_11740 [Geodermatophilus sp.]|nr:hypothetical protein [Geodermatophilus sp.]
MDRHSTDVRTWPCPTCADERLFVQPPCVDGHTEDGGECPEWACADCGTAFFVGEPDTTASAPLHRAA